MKKIQKAAIIYLVIFVQAALAIVAGVFAVHVFADRKLPYPAIAGNVDIGNTGRREAEARIDKYYGEALKSKLLKISINKDGEIYEIPYTDIEAAIDSKATVASVFDNNSSNVLSSFDKEFNTAKIKIKPVIRINEGKLIKSLSGLSSKIDKFPVNADLYYAEGKIVKKPEQVGQKLNIKNAVEKIRSHIKKDPTAVLSFSRFSNYEIETVQPELKLRDLEELDVIIAEYSTKLVYPEFNDAIKRAAEAVDGIVVNTVNGNSSKAVSFSFVDRLKERDAGFDNDNEGYDQVASTLYAALLTAGIDKSSITRIPHDIPVDYIKPGLDAYISGNGGDFKFSNTLGHKVALLLNVEDERIAVRIAGNSKDRRENPVELKVDIVERFAPPVINVESKTLKKGESIVLEQGKEGIRIRVYRNTELVSEDKYQAIKKVVQIGPGTDWTENGTEK